MKKIAFVMILSFFAGTPTYAIHNQGDDATSLAKKHNFSSLCKSCISFPCNCDLASCKEKCCFAGVVLYSLASSIPFLGGAYSLIVISSDVSSAWYPLVQFGAVASFTCAGVMPIICSRVCASKWYNYVSGERDSYETV